jgi:response regulator of citrate/malate metabolism
MDQLEEVPRETLAGRTAATKLKAYKRDFQQVVGFGADNLRSGNLIQAAKFAAETAQKFSTGNAQEVVEWQEAEKLWNGAIDYLKGIKPDDPDFNQAQKLLSQYESKRSSVRVRLEQQQQSIQSLKQAQDLQAQLTNSIQPGTKFLKPQEIALLRKIENTLKEVKPSTTVYKEAQTILKYAQARLK